MIAHYARIQEGVVAEILSLPDDVEVNACFHPEIVATLVPAEEGIAEGMAYANGKFSPPPAGAETETAVPSEVYDYQIIGQAEAEGMFEPEEADAWIGQGVLPVAVEGTIKKIVPDAADQRKFRLFLMGSTVFPRRHDRASLLGALFGKDTDAKLDAFFVAAGQR